jgi:hypothetical protein
MHKTRSCAHTLHKDRVSWVRVEAEKVLWKKLSKGWTDLNKIWRGTVGRKMGRRLRAESTSERVDVGMLEQEGEARVWQP